MSCICGYLHFTRDLQYEFFYLSQYILQFIIYKNISLDLLTYKIYNEDMMNLLQCLDLKGIKRVYLLSNT